MLHELKKYMKNLQESHNNIINKNLKQLHDLFDYHNLNKNKKF